MASWQFGCMRYYPNNITIHFAQYKTSTILHIGTFKQLRVCSCEYRHITTENCCTVRNGSINILCSVDVSFQHCFIIHFWFSTAYVVTKIQLCYGEAKPKAKLLLNQKAHLVTAYIILFHPHPTSELYLMLKERAHSSVIRFLGRRNVQKGCIRFQQEDCVMLQRFDFILL